MELSIREQMLASVSGAGITALTMTPFDVVKGMVALYRHYFSKRLSLIIFSSSLTNVIQTKNCELLQWSNGSFDLLS